MKLLLFIIAFFISIGIEAQVIKNFPTKNQHDEPANLWDTTANLTNLNARTSYMGLYEGALTWIQDIDKFYVYNGLAWVEFSTTLGTLSQWDDVTGGINYADGNVGVGTTTPSTELHVVGSIYATDEYCLGTYAYPFIQDGNGSSFYGGVSSQSTEWYNSVVGYGIGGSGADYRECAIMGHKAGDQLVDGDGNTAIGSSSMYHNVTGDNNTCVGIAAGRSALGDNNVFLGAAAGFEWTGSDRLYIGNGHTSGNSANFIWIKGYNNYDVELPNGDLILSNGTTTAGHILTSDASGKASWAANTGGSGITQWHDVTGGIEYPSGNITTYDTTFFISGADNNDTLYRVNNGDSVYMYSNVDVIIDFPNMVDIEVDSFDLAGRWNFDDKVGIGTTSPTEMLDVNGSIQLNSLLKSKDTTLLGIETITAFPTLDSIHILGSTLGDYLAKGDSIYITDGVNIFRSKISSIDYLFPPSPAKYAIKMATSVPNTDYDTVFHSRIFSLNIDNDANINGTIYTSQGLNITGTNSGIIRRGGDVLFSETNQSLVLGNNNIDDIGARNVITGETIGYGVTNFANSNMIYGSDIYSPIGTGGFTSDTNAIFGWHIGQTLPNNAKIAHNVLIGMMLADLMDTIQGNIWIGEDIYFNPTITELSFFDTYILGMNPNKLVSYVDTTNALLSGVFAPSDMEEQFLRINGRLKIEEYIGIRLQRHSPAILNFHTWFLAGAGNTTSTGNTSLGVGQNALNANTSGAGNTAIGSMALQLNRIGEKNTAIGHSALGENLIGYNNVAIGYAAGSDNTGNNNISIGYNCNNGQTWWAESNIFSIDSNVDGDPPFMIGSMDVDTLGINADVNIHGDLDVENTTSIATEDLTFGGDITFNGDVNFVIPPKIQNIVQQVYNATASTITALTPVFYNGTHTVAPYYPTIYACNPQSDTAKRFAGLVMRDIPTLSYGNVMIHGTIDSVNTISYLPSPLYLDTNKVGNTKPIYPDKVVLVGSIGNSSATLGTVNVYIDKTLDRALITEGTTFTSTGATSGEHYRSGFYDFSTTSITLTQASLVQSYGSADVAYDAHSCAIASAAGSVTGGGVVALITIGEGIDDTQTELYNAVDTLFPNIENVTANEFAEARKYRGTFRDSLVVVSGTPTAYSITFNYGYAAYRDAANRDFYLASFRGEWEGGASNATGFDVRIIHHKQTGWTYAATGFNPSSTNTLYTRLGDQGDYQAVVTGLHSTWKRTGLNTFIEGSASEGLILVLDVPGNSTIQDFKMSSVIAID